MFRLMLPKKKPVMLSTFVEGKHPRGQPENAGEFVKKDEQETATNDKEDKEKERPEWDGVIDESQIPRRGRDSEHIKDWNFVDDNANFEQNIFLVSAEYDTDPDGNDSDSIVTVYRWESRQNGDITDSGDWTTDRDEAVLGGEDHAQNNHETKVEPEEEEEDKEESEDNDETDENDDESGPGIDIDDIPDPVKRPIILGNEKLPKSKAGVVVDGKMSKGREALADKIVQKIFGGDTGDSYDALSDALGMPDDASIIITQVGKYDTLFGDDSPMNAVGVRVEVKHPKLGRVSRFIGVDEDGQRFIKNEILEVKPEFQKEGLGADIFSKQVESAAENGVEYIVTHAAGGVNSSMNGYYTWPRFGYDMSLDDPEARGSKPILKKAKEVVPGAKSILDVMDAPEVQLSDSERTSTLFVLNSLNAKLKKPAKEGTSISGAEWWQVHGKDLYNAQFDLREGSRSLESLAAYLRKQRVKKAPESKSSSPPPKMLSSMPLTNGLSSNAPKRPSSFRLMLPKLVYHSWEPSPDDLPPLEDRDVDALVTMLSDVPKPRHQSQPGFRLRFPDRPLMLSSAVEAPADLSDPWLILSAYLAALDDAKMGSEPAKKEAAALRQLLRHSIKKVHLSWVAERTKRNTIKARGEGEHQGRMLYGEAAQRALGMRARHREDRQHRANKAIEIVRKIYAQKPLDDSDIQQFADNASAMTVAQLRHARGILAARFGGARQQAGMVNALRDHVRGQMAQWAEREAKANEVLPARESRPPGNIVPKEVVPAKTKIKVRKQARGANTGSIFSEVLRLGGIGSRFVGRDDDSAKDMRDEGLLGVFRKGGLSLDNLATQLEDAGHIKVPANRNAEDYLVDLLKSRAKSLLLDRDKEHAAALDAHYKDLEDAKRFGATDEQLAESARVGMEAGESEAGEGISDGTFGDAFEGEGANEALAGWDFWGEVKPVDAAPSSGGEMSDYLDPTKYPTKQEYIDAETKRIKEIDPEIDDETAVGQAEMWAGDRWKPPATKGKYEVGDAVSVGDSTGNYRGTFTGKNGEKMAVVAFQNGGQSSVPINKVDHASQPKPAEQTDLFGQPTYDPPANKKGETGDIFAPGAGWQTTKDDWLAEHGVKVDETGMDQTFRVGKKWYEVRRSPETEELEVVPKLAEVATGHAERVPVDEAIKRREEQFAGKQGPKQGDTNAEGLVFLDGRWHRDEAAVESPAEPSTPEQANAEQPTEASPAESGNGTDGGRAELGRADSGKPGGNGLEGRPKPRIVTAREHLVKPADPSLVPEGVREHLNETQVQGAASAIRSMDAHGGFLLADGTGVGKTRQILAVAQTNALRGKKILIVAPKEVFQPDWKKGTITGSYANDSKAMGLDVALNNGTETLKAGQINLTSYDRIAKLKSQIDKDTVILFDESQALKNWGSARAKHGSEMSKAAGQVMYATATPADKPLHITHLFRAKVFGDKKWEETWRELGMKQVEIHTGGGNYIKQWQVDPKVGYPETYRRMSGLFDRMIEDGLMLKREISLDGLAVDADRIELPKDAVDAVDKVYKDKLSEHGGNKAVALMAARMAQEVHKIPHVTKAVNEELANGRSVIVFAARVNKSGEDDDAEEGEESGTEGTMKLLRESLETSGIDPKTITELHGGATKTPAQKAKAMEAFQSGKARVILATVESGGTGVNLDDMVGDKPRTTVVMTPPFSAVSNVQLAGRSWRLNTKSDAKIRHIFANTDIDDWNAALIKRKMKTHGAVVGGEAMRLDVPSEDETPEVEIGGEHGTPYHWPPLVGNRILTPSMVRGPKITISGDTFTHKDRIKAAGGRWDADKKQWTVTPEQAAKLRSMSGLRFSDNAVEPIIASPKNDAPLVTPVEAVPPMSEARKQAIHEALRHMAGMDTDRARERNDVGFNQMDSNFGAQLAESPTLTDKQAYAAAKMLAKYHRQIAPEHMERITKVDDTPAPVMEAPKPMPVKPPESSSPVKSSYSVGGNTFEHKDRIKAAGGKWNPDRKMWVIPAAAREKLERLSGLRFLSASPSAPRFRLMIPRPGFRPLNGK